MTEYDQERFSELAEELDRTKEKIRCLEADLKAIRLPKCAWLVWSHEHHAWWKPNGNGYTYSRGEAGRYSFKDAFEIVEQANVLLNREPHEAMVPDVTWKWFNEAPMPEEAQPNPDYVPAKPEPYRHQDGDFSKLCDNPHCRCKQ